MREGAYKALAILFDDEEKHSKLYEEFKHALDNETGDGGENRSPRY